MMTNWQSLALVTLMGVGVGCDAGTKTVYVPCPECVPLQILDAGGGGGGGDGGAGGALDGGAGRELDGGAGRELDGGAGGGCVPDCDGRVCGPDTCGGTCGPGCDEGALCSGGECVDGGCPADTFECDGVCVDLLSDPEHCGSCGSTCADAWADAAPIDGLSYRAANITAACVDATCVYQCEDSDVGADELLTDADNCGACNAACDTDAINKAGDTCVEGECRCLLAADEADEPVVGVVCDGHCELANATNCGGACCPRLMPGNNAVAADTVSLFGFDMPDTGTALFLTNFPGGSALTYLFRYEADGTLPVVETWASASQVRTIPVLPAGRYGLLVTAWDEPGGVAFQTSRTPVDFVAPGAQAREASAATAHVTFRVPAAGAYEVLFEPGPDGNYCRGRGVVGLFDGDAEVVAVLADLEECRNRFAARWRGELPAGTYTVRAFAETLRGDWQVRVAP